MHMTIVNVIIAVAILFLIYSAFLKPEIYEDMWDSVINTFSPPERDPYPWEININSNRAQAMDYFKDVVKQFELISQDEIGLTESCFGSFPKPSEEFLNNKFSIRITKESNGMSLQLFEFKSNADGDQQASELWVPVLDKFMITNYTPCVIYSSGATNFYQKVISEKTYTNEQGQTAPKTWIEFHPLFRFNYSVNGIRIYEKDKIYFYYGPQSETSMKLDFKVGDDRFNYYILKYYALPNEQPSLCLIPTSDDSSCKVKDNVLSEGCLDEDETDSIPSLLNGRLSPAICEGFTRADLQ